MLGAGIGTRTEPLAGETGFHAKPALPLVGRESVATALINQMVRHGVTNIGVNTFFKPEQVKQSIFKELLPGGNVHFLDEKELTGPAGPLAKLLLDPKHQAGLDTSKHLLMVQGDAVTDVNFSSLLRKHQKSGALITIGCQEVPLHDVDKFGIIVTDKSGEDGSSGKILSFQEKPKQSEAKSRLANTGFYLFSPKVWPILKEMAQQYDKDVLEPLRKAGHKEIPQKYHWDFGYHVFPQLLKKVTEDPSLGSFHAQKTTGYWNDIGNPTEYFKTVHKIMDGKTDLRFPKNSGFERENGVLFWPGTKEITQKHGAQLSGNVLVMKKPD
jgi:mannose-1-phosphate guanylyltransferase